MNNILLNKGQFSSFSPEINAKNDENSWGLARWTKRKRNCPWTISCQCSKYYSWILIDVGITESSKRVVSKLIFQSTWLACSLEIKWSQKVQWHVIMFRHVVLAPFWGFVKKIKEMTTMSWSTTKSSSGSHCSKPD